MPAECTSFSTELDTCHFAGEQVKRPHKKQSDAGKPHKCKAPEDQSTENIHSKKKRKGDNRAMNAAKSVEILGDTNNK